MEKSYEIESINGPVIGVRDDGSLSMHETVFVGEGRLAGEVVNIFGERAVVQVYEETAGLAPGAPVYGSGAPLSLRLGPGLLGGILDGIGRPLRAIAEKSGAFIARGVNAPTLDAEKKWAVRVLAPVGGSLAEGQVFATCRETEAIEFRAAVPQGMAGEVVFAAKDGEYTVDDTLVTIESRGKTENLTLAQLWPIRKPRPAAKKLPPALPLLTGQRVIDTFFPVAKGGAACLPGPFGAGKTVTQHQLAKWSDADIIIYIGCGERGNEMTEALEEFSALKDPRTGSAMSGRTVLIANTSNMPVASREASIYTGVTIAEFYRDMGYHVAVMADSTSRWAEALREISGRLEEMPAEEGYPAYLSSRLAEFYERAGFVETLSGALGSVTLIGAVSPQGSDFSEPVTQNTKRYTRAFWALDRALAYARHFPAINWNASFSEYFDELEPWYRANVGSGFLSLRKEALALLFEEGKLLEITKLIGTDILPDDQKLVIETARVLRVGFLQQNVFNKTDSYVTLEKQHKMLETALHLHSRAGELVRRAIPISQLKATGIFEKLLRMKYEVENDRPEGFAAFRRAVDEAVDGVIKENS